PDALAAYESGTTARLACVYAFRPRWRTAARTLATTLEPSARAHPAAPAAPATPAGPPPPPTPPSAGPPTPSPGPPTPPAPPAVRGPPHPFCGTHHPSGRQHRPPRKEHVAMTTTLSVIGVGYLGAVHAAAMAELGHDVIGLDIDAERISALQAGIPPFHEPG